MNNSLILSLFLTLGSSIFATNGGISEIHPIQIQKKCNSLVLKGRDDYKNIAYIMPRVILDRQNNQSGSELIKLDENNYQLRLSLYFPHQQSESSDQGEDITCPDNTIIQSLKTQGHAISKTGMVHPYNGKINIRDLNGNPQFIAPGNSNLVDLRGQTRIVVFDLNKIQVQTFKKLLQTSTGVQVDVNLMFMMRGSDGKMSCSLDNDYLFKQLHGGLKGNTKKIKTTFDLQAILKNVIEETATNCSIEASSSDQFDKRAEGMLNQILTTIGRQYNSRGSNSPSSGSSSGTLRQRMDEARKLCRERNPEATTEENRECICQEVPDYPSCQGDNFFDESKWKEILGILSEYEVNAAIDYIKSQSNIELNIDQVSTQQEESYSTSFILKDRNSVGKYQEIQVDSNQEYITLEQNPLNKGDELVLIPSKKIIKTISTTSSQYYYNKSRISSLITEPYFSTNDSQDTFVSCEDQSLLANKPNLILLDRINPDKIKSLAGDQRAYISHFFKKYYWGQITYKNEYLFEKEESISINSLNEFINLPIKVSFSKIGPRKFSLEEIVDLDSYLRINYNSKTKAIHIMALEDMGHLSFHNQDQIDKKIQYPIKHFIEFKANKYCSSSDRPQMVAKKQSSYRIYIHQTSNKPSLINASF